MHNINRMIATTAIGTVQLMSWVKQFSFNDSIYLFYHYYIFFAFIVISYLSGSEGRVFVRHRQPRCAVNINGQQTQSLQIKINR